ncbi:MAG TPA: hypothetical protein VGB85_09950, partial [Nannocystis sp.]
DLLGKAIEVGRIYDPVVPLLARALQETGDRTLLDLCSGGGGPVPSLRRLLARDHGIDVEARLSDFYPNTAAFERIAAHEQGRVTYEATPIDATRVPRELAGFRTMFTCMHHFRPAQAEAILRDAWTADRGIAVFEFTERSVAGMAQMFLSPISAMVLTPLIRPFRWSRLALTYVVPVLPAVFMFDGIVSQLRTYTPDELRAMTRPLQRPGYRWEIGTVKHPLLPGRVSYLLGLPTAPR